MSAFSARSRALTKISTIYLLLLGTTGIIFPFLNVYLEANRGLTGRQIGIIAAISSLMTLLITPLWGTLADRLGSRVAVLRLLVAGAAVAIMLVPITGSFGWLLGSMILFYAFLMGIAPIYDGLVANETAKLKVDYGALRLFGSIGFALVSFLFGKLSDRLGLGAMFPAFATLHIIALPILWKLVPEEAPAQTEKTAWSLLSIRPIAAFLAVGVIAAIGITFGYMFMFVFLGSLGASRGLMGAAAAIGALVEVPFMLWSGKLIRKHGAPLVFALGVAMYGLAFGGMALIKDPTWALGLQILNGAGMGLVWPAAVIFIFQRAPKEQMAGAQSLIGAAFFGIAPLIASQLAGILFDLSGPRVVSATASGIMALALVAYGMLRGLVLAPTPNDNR